MSLGLILHQSVLNESGDFNFSVPSGGGHYLKDYR